MITVEQYPAQIMPVYNDIVFVASSDNTAQDNFRYVVDVYRSSILINRLIIPPNPITNDLYVNVAPILESLVSKNVDVEIGDNSIEANQNSYVDYTVRFGEQYGSSGTIYSDLVTTSTFTAWNSIFDYEDYVDYSSGDYALNTSLAQFLTNRPTSGDIYDGDNAWIYSIRFTTSGSHSARVITYDSNNAVIANRVLAIVASQKAVRIPIGPNNINDNNNATIISGPVQPIFTASVAKYSVQMLTSIADTTPLSEVYYFTVATNCSEYDRVNVVFMNKLGGYDSFSFTQSHKNQSSIERKEYKTSMGSASILGGSFVYSKGDRAITQYHTKIRDTYSLESDWITEEQSEWLEELITSPDVYIDKGDVLVPIVVLNSGYERKKGINEKLFNLRLEYKYSYERYRQRR